MAQIELNMDNILPHLSMEEIERLQPEVTAIHHRMEKGEGPGNNFLGWLHLPSHTSEELLDHISQTAQKIRDQSDAFVTIGIGGSYLGAKAAITFLKHSFFNQIPPTRRRGPEIYFAGQNISSDYLADLADLIKGRRVTLNVISKSGTTTEPAIAFRILKSLVEGQEEARERIVVITDQSQGVLKKLADREIYRTFVIPDDVGGRYSVLTPVGLLPMAVAGINVRALIQGARKAEEAAADPNLLQNAAYRYAAIRYLLYKKGKAVEILSSFHPGLHDMLEWWKQLAGESEGKGHQGLFPASADFTTDLHSLGQWIQEGSRNLFETFVTVRYTNRTLEVPFVADDPDGLNYLSGKTLEEVNRRAYEGTAEAHREGGVPNMTLSLEDRSPETLGELFYFFERAIAMTGYLMGVNPFDQPGVELYKKNMFKLLGKPEAV